MNRIIARIAFVFSLLAMVSCENDMNAIMNLDKSTTAVEEGKDIESMYSQTGRVKAKLTAPMMLRHLKPPVYVEFSKGLKVLFYNDSLDVESTLTARYGKYFENDANIFLRDHVVVINKKGERLDCEELNWDSKLQKFLSNKPVRISTVTDTLYGTGLESNQDFSDYTILHPSGPFIIQDSTMMN
ncbi:LPS export ABC transporter periplasmic protein LptC [Chitinophaga filiformis]|uniref:LPS export ABC transporter periplasmic protein LptC n=1 Tax=Chitinophaga filiformis TaxID=104663 RepID=UPI001F3B18DC|nr:LPS export ABC transporter periplasmic protein LptC [Chitinophaga filiformis]MCF6401656.1 LPS export ABC transporter periplasmic protein LptC [Chitinophaga filiformis]